MKVLTVIIKVEENSKNNLIERIENLKHVLEVDVIDEYIELEDKDENG